MKLLKALGHVASIAGPIAASFIPGVGPLAMTLLGAGGGAASGALSGGKKGALIGAGLGAATGGLGSLGRPASEAAYAAKWGGGNNVSGFGSGLLGKIFSNPAVDAALINGGMNLLGTKMQAGTNNKAAEIDAQSKQAALDWLKEQYAIAQGQYKPFLDASTAAVGRMSDQAAHLPDPMSLLGREGYQPSAAPQANPMTGRPMGALAGPGGQPVSTTMPVGGGHQLVTLKAPNGETRQFAANDPKVARHLARGAQRVG